MLDFARVPYRYQSKLLSRTSALHHFIVDESNMFFNYDGAGGGATLPLCRERT